MDETRAQAEAIAGPIRFQVDPSLYEATNRSFRTMAESRFCYSCQQKVGLEREEEVPVTDPETGRVRFETRVVVYGEDPFAVIRDCCSRAKGYISPNMPIMEMVFRLFLASGNEPMTASEIRDRLEEWVGYADRVRTLSPATIERMLLNDHRYGFRRVELTYAG